MSEEQFHIEQLKRSITNGRAVVVIGSGVSRSSAGMPGWRGAAESALDHLVQVGTCDAVDVANLRKQLEVAESSNELITVASLIRKKLTGSSVSSGEFAAWLEVQFGVGPDAVNDASLLRAIHALPSCLLTTTNYDKLLSSTKAGLQPVTWQEPTQLIHSLKSTSRVVHLHGVWDAPETVVFGAEDYDAILGAEAYRAFLQAIWMDRALLFIGCSLDGLRDPDFTRLMDWMTTNFPSSYVRHFALVRSGSYSVGEASEFLNRWRIQLIPYGTNHADLVPFLEKLPPPTVPSVPAPPQVFEGRGAQLASLKESISNRETVLVHGMAGIGKSSFASKALEEYRSERATDKQIWVEQATPGLVNLCRRIGIAAGLDSSTFLSDEESSGLVARELQNLGESVLVVDQVIEIESIRVFRDRVLPPNIALIAISQIRDTGFDRTVHIGPLTLPEAEAVFRKVGDIRDQDSLVQSICAQLEGHPLSIMLAAGRHLTEDLPLERLLLRLKELGESSFLIELFRCKSAIYGDMRRPDLALAALASAQQLGLDSGAELATHASIKCLIGNMFTELNRLIDAEVAMRAGLEDATNSGDRDLTAQLNGQLGLVLKLMRRFKESSVQYLTAKAIYQECGNLVGVAACNHNLAEIAETLGDAELAWILDCESLLAELQADNMAGAFGSLERLASRVNSDERFEFVIAQADKLFENTPYVTLSEHVGMAEAFKAIAHIRFGNQEEAESLLLESVRLREQIEDFKGIGVCFGNLSNLKMLQGKLEDAWTTINGAVWHTRSLAMSKASKSVC